MYIEQGGTEEAELDGNFIDGEEGKVQIEGSEDLLESQESVNDFARNLGIIVGSDKEEPEKDKRNSRLKGKEDKLVLEMATGRKEAQNAFLHKDTGGRNKKASGGSHATKNGGA